MYKQVEKLVKKDVTKEGLTAEYSARVIGRSNIVKDSNNKINGLSFIESEWRTLAE
jgi:hypothetical protein